MSPPVKRGKKSIETDSEMMQMLELAEKDVKITTPHETGYKNRWASRMRL